MIGLQAGYLLDGKYQLIKPLGKGGEGSVWLALHLRTEQFWAVKMIPKTARRREFHELNMMKQLHHISLPRVIDVLEEDLWICLVMEYIHGYSLETFMSRKKRMTQEQVLDVGLQIGKALCYLHGRKPPVLHLDIKPANVIQRKGGGLVLVDFGSARKVKQGTGGEMRRGTVGFAAPEQYDPALELSQRTDIYGLGAMLYYLISGVYYSPAMAKSRIPGCPEWLAAVIRTCMQEDPGKRYGDARQFCHALGAAGKRYRRRGRRCSLWISLALMSLAAGVAVWGIPREFAVQGKRQWNYEELLQEALCTDGEERFACYQRAVFSDPQRKEAYLQYLRQADADGCFDRSEEEAFRQLLHMLPLGSDETYEEMLARDPENYGEVASALGMMYWYDYQGDGGRTMGTGWFSKAVSAGEKVEGEPWWKTRARLFAHMGSYFERLGKEDESGERENPAKAYWEDLGELMELNMSEYDHPATILRFFRETLVQISFHAGRIRESGVTWQEMDELIGEILRRAGETVEENQEGGMEAQLYEEVKAQGETARELLANLADYEGKSGQIQGEQSANGSEAGQPG